MTKTSHNTVINTSLEKAMGERYLNYALSTITARSLPDVRDGLKPVHRRILYAMQESGNTPNKGFKKSASAVGYVMMKYHPHGDQAIYDSMVRMVQPFSIRYPLIEGQGNFGSIDGDNAAAMRYTEAKLSSFSTELLDGVYENSVDFTDSYNGESKEPQVLPTRIPNLLANGSSGIAVGMATNVPPHNLTEICEALLYLLKHPDASIKKLMEYIPGPDFPTGGIIVEPQESIVSAYTTGRGSIRMRARYEVEKLANGQYQIVITEIPYLVHKSRVIEKIADLWNAKKLPLLSDICDESTTDIRIVITPKTRTVEPELLMESLYRNTELEMKFNLNLNVLDNGKIPRLMNISEILQSFLNHRQDVICRRSQNRLNDINKRLEILQGFIVAFLNLDQVIKIIRFSDDPKQELIQTFELTILQAESILNMRLRSLRKLEEMQIKKEITNLQVEREQLEQLLQNTELQLLAVANDLKDIKRKYNSKVYSDKRRTTFAEVPDINLNTLEILPEKEPVTVVCSQNGWIRALKGHDIDAKELRFKEGDSGRFLLECNTTDKLIILDKSGKVYNLGVDSLPGGRGNGEPINIMVDIANGPSVVDILVYDAKSDRDSKVIVASSDGRGFITSATNLIAQTKNGKQIMNVGDDVEAQIMHKCPASHDYISIVGHNRKMLVYKISEIPEMNRGKGVVLQKYKQGLLSDITTFEFDKGLSWKIGDRVRNETNLLAWLGKRGQVGKIPPVGFPKNNKYNN